MSFTNLIGNWEEIESKNNYSSNKMDDIIPISSLFVLFFIVGGNFLAPLFPCGIQKMLHTNMYMKHILAFFTLFFFVKLTSFNDKLKLKDSFIQSLWLYIWFILATTLDSKFFLILISLFAIIYTMNIFIKQKEEETYLKRNDYVRNLDNIKDIIYYFAIVLTTVGIIIQYGKKRYEYKDNFNFWKFLFGVQKCAISNSKLTNIQALKYVFS